MNWILISALILPLLFVTHSSLACSDQVLHHNRAASPLVQVLPIDSATNSPPTSTNSVRIGRLWKKVLAVQPKVSSHTAAVSQSLVK
jgi:hypothetical protein